MLSEAEIGARHRQRWDEAKAAIGPDATGHDVPSDVRDAINEAHRQDWIEHNSIRDGKATLDGTSTAPAARHGAKELGEFVQKFPGFEVDAVTLAAACHCSEGTARSFITSNPSMFSAVSGQRGTYTIRDVAAERAAAKAS